MKVLELFCGTKSFTKVAEARGHECRTLDNNPQFEPTYCMDIMDFEPAILGDWKPDVIWASPPCQCFSVMVISKNWEEKRVGKLPSPKRLEAKLAMGVVLKTKDIIIQLKPTYWFIENPRGTLRKMAFMQGWLRSTVTYCQYGLKYQKATDIWNNCYEWKPRPVCSPRSPCHARAPRGSRYGVQGVRADGKRVNSIHPLVMGEAKGQQSADKYYRWQTVHERDVRLETGWGAATIRAVVPPQLCEEIITACEKAIA